MSLQEKQELGFKLLAEQANGDGVKDSNGDLLREGECYAVFGNGCTGAYEVSLDSLKIPTVWIQGVRGYFRKREGKVMLDVTHCYMDDSLETTSYWINGILRFK